MNPFKINQSLTFNIYSFSGYLMASIYLLVHLFLPLPVFYILLVVLFCYFYINFFVFAFLPITYLCEIIYHRKFVWKFNEKYNKNKLALGYFWIGILLNLVVYYITYKLIKASRYLITS